jgi:hypothetical protein
MSECILPVERSHLNLDQFMGAMRRIAKHKYGNTGMQMLSNTLKPRHDEI